MPLVIVVAGTQGVDELVKGLLVVLGLNRFEVLALDPKGHLWET